MTLTLYSGLKRAEAIARTKAIGREERKLRELGGTGNYSKWYFCQEFRSGEGLGPFERMRTYYRVVVETLEAEV